MKYSLKKINSTYAEGPMRAITLRFFSKESVYALITVLELYTGKFSCYRGAVFFSIEAKSLLIKLKNISIPSQCDPVFMRTFMPCDPIAELELSYPEEIMAIIRALEIYLGHYPEAYRGAILYAKQASNLKNEFAKHHNKVTHLLK